MAVADPELENNILERLKGHIAAFEPIQLLEDLNIETASSTPSGQSQGQGLVLGVDVWGGDSTPTTTGDRPGGGKDRTEVFVVLSATLWHRERAQANDTTTPQQARDIVAARVRTACGALRALIGTITLDPALPGDDPGYQGIWYNARLGFPSLKSWIYHDAEGQFRQAQIGLTLYVQQTRMG